MWNKKISGKFERKWRGMENTWQSFHFCKYELNREQEQWEGKILKKIIEVHEPRERQWILDWKSTSNTKQDEWKKIYIWSHPVKFHNSKDRKKIPSYC